MGFDGLDEEGGVDVGLGEGQILLCLRREVWIWISWGWCAYVKYLESDEVVL